MRLDKLRWHRRSRTCAVGIYSCRSGFQKPQSHFPWDGCAMTSLKGRSSFVISAKSAQGGTWTCQGAAPALADASIPQSPVVQREFKPLSMVNSIHIHKPEGFYSLLSGGFWVEIHSFFNSPQFSSPLTLWWLIFWSGSVLWLVWDSQVVSQDRVNPGWTGWHW